MNKDLLDLWINEKRRQAAIDLANETEDQKANREANLARLDEEKKSAEMRKIERLAREEEEAIAKERERQRALRESESIANKIWDLIKKHIHVLARKRNRISRPDEYGYTIHDEKAWSEEVDYFIKNIVNRELESLPCPINSEIVSSFIVREIESYRLLNADAAQSLDNLESLSAIDYEIWCAELLRKAGWSAHLTKASGDQGADIVAERTGIRVVVQCKKYSKAVGNAAVQEVIAAKSFWKSTHAAVVSNAPYTQSAVDLANSAGVALLHHDDLPSIHEFFK